MPFALSADSRGLQPSFHAKVGHTPGCPPQLENTECWQPGPGAALKTMTNPAVKTDFARPLGSRLRGRRTVHWKRVWKVCCAPARVWRSGLKKNHVSAVRLNVGRHRDRCDAPR